MIDWAIAGARLFQFGSTLVLFGSALFFLYGYPDEPNHDSRSDPERAWTRWLLGLAAAVGIASSIAWLSAEAASLTGVWTSIPVVVAETQFGEILALRGVLLAASIITCLVVHPAKPRDVIVSVLAGAAVASFAWTGHGSIGTGSGAQLHLGADVIHLLAAALWLGALVPLGVLLLRSHHADSMANQHRIARGLARFSTIGPTVIALLILTGLLNSWYLIGLDHWAALFDTAYGVSLLVKLGLFGGMLALAAINRFELTPRLRAASISAVHGGSVLRALRSSLLAECLLGLLVIASVAVLGTLEPPVSGS